MSNQNVLAALVLGAGIAAAGYFSAGREIDVEVQSEAQLNTATVAGIAEREVVADAAVWAITFTSRSEQLQDVHQQASQNQQKIVAFLTAGGFKPEEITRSSLAVKKRKQVNRKKAEFFDDEINGSVTVKTKDVQKVATMHREISRLAQQGVMITASTPHYLFTGVQALRDEMVSEATKKARAAAMQFASDAGVEIEGVHRLFHGPMEVTPRDNQIKMDHKRVIDKKIRMVTTLTFMIDED